MKRHLLDYLNRIGLLDRVPESAPKAGTVLARGVCFLHDDADNRNGFILYADGFACTTHDCHRKHGLGLNLEGLIRHMVYRLTGEVMPWRAAWKFAQSNPDQLKRLAQQKVRPGRGGQGGSPNVSWSSADLAACLDVPDPFYLSRGYSRETLEHFGVGRCVRPLPDGQSLPGWAVIPCLDRPWLPPHGYTARNPRWVKNGPHIKWFHGLQASQCLFNSCNAGLGRPRKLFICEGPGCVMRLHEAGFPHAVATLGPSMSDEQYGRFLSLVCHDQSVYVAADDDDTGRRFAEQVRRKIGGVCEPGPFVLFPPAGHKDFGDVPSCDLAAWLRDRLAA